MIKTKDIINMTDDQIRDLKDEDFIPLIWNWENIPSINPQNEATKHIIQTFRKLSPNAIRLASELAAELDCQGISAKEAIEKCQK